MGDWDNRMTGSSSGDARQMNCNSRKVPLALIAILKRKNVSVHHGMIVPVRCDRIGQIISIHKSLIAHKPLDFVRVLSMCSGFVSNVSEIETEDSPRRRASESSLFNSLLPGSLSALNTRPFPNDGV
jgi:hypothetical protein